LRQAIESLGELDSIYRLLASAHGRSPVGRWKSGSLKEGSRLLREAHFHGVNIFDAAVVYGQYTSRENSLRARSLDLLREAFGSLRDQVYYCVKIGQRDEMSHFSDYSPKNLTAQTFQALKQLGTFWIDICLLHAPSLDDIRSGKALAVLETLRECGHVRAIGYAVENEPQHALMAIEQGVDVLMMQYNLIDQECSDVIAKAYAHATGILVCGPFKRGYLTGRFSAVGDLPLHDHYWKWNTQHNPRKVEALIDRVKVLQTDFASPEGLRREALRFILAEAGVSSVIVGHRTEVELWENLTITQDLMHLEQQSESLPQLEADKLDDREE
jgi:aryl-alcohol dehydrogenase-like predicted oxidoreductase